MRALSLRRPVARLAAPAAFAAAVACAVNPVTGRREFSLISESQEIAMGRQYDQQVVAQMGLYPDPALQAYVQDLGSRLAAQSERPHLPWTFRVVDDPVVNAFALPGGFVYITRGILAQFQSEAQLTAVLGHEIGHVTAKHSVSQASRAQLAQLGLVVGMVIKPELQEYAGIASAGLGLLFLKYGRDDERQADDLGLRYMRLGGWDPRQMPGVFTMLESVSQASGGGRTPEWLSTHPNPGNRRERIQAALDSLPQDFSGLDVSAASYLRRLDGMVYGANPRDGYFRDTEFFHPDLAFRFRFPDGWATQNQRSAVIGVSPEQDAIVQIGLSQETSPVSAAEAFFGQEGVRGSAQGGDINGLPAHRGAFTVIQDDGVLAGHAAFVFHGGAVYRLLTFSSQAQWPSYTASATRSIESFRRLTDPAVLSVQPQRLSIVDLPRSMTVQEFAQAYPTPVSVETIVLLNQLSRSRFAPGALVKRVVGEVVR